MEQDYFDLVCRLWREIGGIQAYANPNGPIATESTMTPEQRLQAVWAIVEDLKPTQS